jgi:hypothetical protein
MILACARRVVRDVEKAKERHHTKKNATWAQNKQTFDFHEPFVSSLPPRKNKADI